MEVLDADQDGVRLGEGGDQVEHRSEGHAGFGRQRRRHLGRRRPGTTPAGGQLGDRDGCVAVDLADQVLDRGEGEHLAAEGQASSEVDERSAPLGRLAQQRGLADARVPADEQDRGESGPGLVDGTLDLGEVRLPAHEPTSSGAMWHSGQYPPRRRSGRAHAPHRRGI